MKILAITTLFPNPYGTTRAPYNLAQLAALARAHSVEVISPIAWTEEALGRWHGTPRLPTPRKLVRDRLTVHHPRFWYPPKFLRRQHGPLLKLEIKRLFQETVHDFQPDVVLGCWAYPDGWAAVGLARETGLPVAVKVHGCDVLDQGRGIANMRASYPGTLEALRRADAVVAVSADLAENVASHGVPRERLHVVYNGIDTTLFFPMPKSLARKRLGIAQRGAMLLYVGNLVPVKGVDTLIDACVALVRNGVQFRCYVIGDGPLRRRLRNRVRAAGIADFLTLVGPRPHSELADWYRAADLFVLPSNSEGIPNVLLEASACGTPSVATRVGGVSEVTDPRRLVPPRDPEALARAVQLALLNPTAVPTALLRSASWERSAEALASVLLGCARSTAASPIVGAPSDPGSYKG